MRTNWLSKSLCYATSALCALTTVAPAFAKQPTTPIKHVIIIVGENHTFDNLYGTYRPRVRVLLLVWSQYML